MSQVADKFTVGLTVYLVGGAVRDELMGYPFHERDWVVVGSTPEEMLNRGFRQVGRDFPVFLHPETAEEYALARTERKSGRGYTGFVVDAAPSVTLEQDLERRDLTINAIAKSSQQLLVDPFDGQRDIKQGILRHVGSAFVEDPLRVLRVARFQARYAHLGFHLAAETSELILQMGERGELKDLAAERVWKESEKALMEQTPVAFFALLKKHQVLSPWFDELNDEGIYTKAVEWLTKAVSSGLSTVAERLSLMLIELDKSSQEILANRLRLPNHVRDAMSLMRFSRECLYSWQELTLDEQSDVLLDWCQKVDIWRRYERVDQLTAALELALPHLSWTRIHDAVLLAAKVSPRDWDTKGMRGKQIGEKLINSRRSAIKESLIASVS